MNFFQNMGQHLTEVFRNGLGGPGAEGIGLTIMVIGLVMAVISFLVHKFNPQSRMPGWFTCLLIGLAGSVLVGGIDRPLNALKGIRDVLYEWLSI